MAIRLCENKIKLHKKEEIESTVVNRGCIQIPRGGKPIVLMSDSQSTGGYLSSDMFVELIYQRSLKFNQINY